MKFEGLEKNGHIFKTLYRPVSILPPDQYLALVVQLTEGCNFNQCLFCNFYKDSIFHIKNNIQLKKHLRDLKDFFGAGLHLRKSIFLADANALVTPAANLAAALKTIKTFFPDQADFYSFIDAFTGIKKSLKEFKLLKSLGLNRVYLGIESGHAPLLQFLQKPQKIDHIVSLVQMLKAAEIKLGVIFLAGAGGMEYHSRHLLDSTTLVKNLELSQGDLIYVSEFVNNNSNYINKMKRFNLPIPTAGEILSCTNELKTAISNAVPIDVKVSTYAINQFLY